jgi:DNA invertase Pin-like site-specific DNA recombinase
MAILLLSVMGAFAEFERSLIRERQREGISIAKARGVYQGRKRSLATEQILTLRQQVNNGAKKAKVAREFNISRETLYQYLRDNSIMRYNKTYGKHRNSQITPGLRSGC